MIRSMTAFSRQASEQDWGSFVWEIRSVNHRYLEPSFKLPELIRHSENQFRELLRAQLSRGKVECSLRLQMQPAANIASININRELLGQIISAAESVQQQLQQPAGIDPMQCLHWPGVLSEPKADSDMVQTQVVTGFKSAIAQLLESREREGDVLKQFIEQRLQTISEITTEVKQQLPAILAAQRQKLQERLQELSAELDSDRLEQEMVILAQKADVDEELDRLFTHVKEVQRVLNKGGTCGRRLDFLMQELNREANTLSSKSIVSDTTQAAVELKVLIEQMREQIQNIE